MAPTVPARVTSPALASGVTTQKKIVHVRKVLSESLIERFSEVDGALTAMLAGQNFLMVGSPGTAKSLLCDGMLSALDGDLQSFSYLFMKTSTPEDIFGPYDVPGLMERRYERVVDGYLPTAHVAFLDEIWKAGPAILNSLLKILNEKTFRQGKSWLKCPLLFALAASNEYPADEGGKELAALFDRFTIRMNVKKIGSEEGLRRLLFGPRVEFKFEHRLTLDDLASARSAVREMIIPAASQECLLEIIRKLRAEGVDPGDRRKLQATDSLRAFAYLSGRKEVTTEDMEILAHVLWDDPIEQPNTVVKVVSKIANPTGFQITSGMTQANDIIADLDKAGYPLDKLASAAAKLKDIAERMSTLRDPRALRLKEFALARVKELATRAVGG